jgi:hypothetical protein
VLHLVRHLVKADLLGDALTALPVLGPRLVVEDLVDLLERETLELEERSVDGYTQAKVEAVTNLRQDEDGVEKTDDTEAHEDDVGLVADVRKHHRGDLGDSEVHNPAKDKSVTA